MPHRPGVSMKSENLKQLEGRLPAPYYLPLGSARPATWRYKNDKFHCWGFQTSRSCFCLFLTGATHLVCQDGLRTRELSQSPRTMLSTYAILMHPYCPDRESNPGLPRDRRGLWHCTTCLALENFWSRLSSFSGLEPFFSVLKIVDDVIGENRPLIPSG